MNWKPIGKDELILIVQHDVSEMDRDLKGKFEALRTPLHQVLCNRGGEYGNEKIFVLACAGDQILIFDDVEEEYGIALRPPQDEHVLKKWSLVGSLATVVRHLR